MKPEGRYFIITNADDYAERWHKKCPKNVFQINRPAGAPPLNTYDLLVHPETAKILQKNKSGAVSSTTTDAVNIIVFKNTSRIEALCKEKKWNLLNPSAELAEKIENKITQVTWLGRAASYFPPHKIMNVSDIRSVINIKNQKTPFIIQWAHGHTGDGTILIPGGTTNARSKKILTDLEKKFPDRECRVTDYIKGPMFTANICIMCHDKKNAASSAASSDILIGNISYQITGVLPFTDNPFATIGNDWSLPHSLLSEKKLAEFNEIAMAVADKMRTDGWTGLFGIDCIYDEERDTLHLIEVNARQPASVTYESQLQEKIRDAQGAKKTLGMTIFEAHIAALTSDGQNQPAELIEINDGAQIVDRIKSGPLKDATAGTISVENLRQKNYTVIEYENTKLGTDHIRIQSERGIMMAHNAFNGRGKEILKEISKEISATV
jgi:hypothetical protein